MLTQKDATIRGKMTNSAGTPVGYHDVPNRNLKISTCLNIGRLSLKRIMVIPVRNKREANARTAHTHLYKFSLKRMIIPHF
jgi:hypothetical protein